MTSRNTIVTRQMQLGGVHCSSCALKIETNLQKLAGVSDVSVVATTGQLRISYDPQQVNEQTIDDQIVGLGYAIVDSPQSHSHHDHAEHSHAGHSHDRDHKHDHHSHDHSHDHDHPHSHGEFSLKRELPSVLLVVALLAIGIIFETPLHNTPWSLGEYGILIPAYLISGWSVLRVAGRNILRGQVFDEMFLMSVATLGAIAVHKLPEAVGVMLFYKVGELFQESAVNRSRRSIQALLEIRPDAANLKSNGEIRVVSPESVQIGDRILVKPGERIPLDGDVIEGSSWVDASALTGESVPRSANVGDRVLAGMINQSGVLTVEVRKRFGDSSIARILDLVENASHKKATTEKFITRFAQRYTPIVVFLALAIALVPPLVIPNATAAEWFYRALILLVISCPCGLVISIPLGYFGGIGGAAKRGILVKGSTFLDALAAVKTVVFDKTGTLTQGTFRVTEIVPSNGFSPSRILELAALVEAHSNHPVAQSIRSAYGQPIDDTLVQKYLEIPGYGVRATINGQTVIAGNDRMLQREGITYDRADVGGSVVHLAIDGTYMGHLLIADELKSDAAQAIHTLKTIGIEKTIMLTGDHPKAADRVAHQLGLDGVIAELLPEDKVTAFETILQKVHAGTSQKQRDQHRVAFVGDGINDAPVIARSDVGIAMGGLGSDAAIETADVVLMNDSPAKVAEAIQIGRKTLTIVWQNILGAIVIKAIFIVLGIFGVATMWEAVFADIGVALLAILNATRVLK